MQPSSLQQLCRFVICARVAGDETVLVSQLVPYLPRPIMNYIVGWLVEHKLHCMMTVFEYYPYNGERQCKGYCPERTCVKRKLVLTLHINDAS